jgi:hypothetical protein
VHAAGFTIADRGSRIAAAREAAMEDGTGPGPGPTPAAGRGRLRYRYVLRIGPEHVGSRVVVRWRRPTVAGPDEVADVLGRLEAIDDQALRVRTRHGDLIVIPRARALAGKVVPPR